MPLARHDYGLYGAGYIGKSFYSHASCEAWRYLEKLYRELNSFYSHASCEAWPTNGADKSPNTSFLLTCLLRGMTSGRSDRQKTTGFLLTCLLRGMTEIQSVFATDPRVSTHMPLARHDFPVFHWWARNRGFYSHASCEAWLKMIHYKIDIFGFYSHASCEAWLYRLYQRRCYCGFYSHASCEAWLRRYNILEWIVDVSTHMPLARHDVLYTYSRNT